MPICFLCNRKIDQTRIGRTDVCPFCNADLHCCLNCRHYDAGAYNQCRESQAERIIDKERANFCDYFFPREAASIQSTTSAAAKANPLDALFGKSQKTKQPQKNPPSWKQ
ncbi:MAG: hypothetical protein N3B18_05405 [Desulfobacterota bacterium]|nr:hypothetical protein [Thermodesulfobacteriota bacterium]